MRVIIFGDMEGVSGIVHWGQIQAGGPRYEEGRRLYTEELNAAIDGAFSAGATRVVVVDGHGAGAAGTMGPEAFNSIVPELIDERCEFITHHGWGNYQRVLAAEPFDAAFFIGIHARSGTPQGALCHTIAGYFRDIFVNGQPVGEIALVAAIAGHFGVPMVMISGDDKACLEAAEVLPESAVRVAVKRSLSYYSAQHIPPRRARQMIREGAYAALRKLEDAEPLAFPGPVTIRLEITSAEKMETFRRLPGVELEGDRTVISRGEDFLTAWERVAPYSPVF